MIFHRSLIVGVRQFWGIQASGTVGIHVRPFAGLADAEADAGAAAADTAEGTLELAPSSVTLPTPQTLPLAASQHAL